MLANALETVASIFLRSMVGIGSAPQLLLGEHLMMLHTSFSMSTLYEDRLGGLAGMLRYSSWRLGS